MKLVFLRNKLRQARLLTKGILLGELPLKRIDKFFKPLPQSAPHKDFKKHCYITWKSNRLPRSHAEDLAKFIAINSEYDFHFFDDKAQQAWMEENFPRSRILEIYNGMKFPAAKSGIFRYSIVWKLGGTYFSINRFTHLPISQLIGNLDDFKLSFSKVPYPRESEFLGYPQEYKGLSIIEYTVSAPPGNQVLFNALRMIEDKAPLYWNKRFEKVSRAIWGIAGPYLLTDAVDKYLTDTGVNLEIQGFDFNDSLWVPRGLEFRYFQSPSYMSFENEIVLGD